MLVERLFGDRPVPDNFDLMAELNRRVRSGEIGLQAQCQKASKQRAKNDPAPCGRFTHART
jgi:hypothetical protein